VSFACAHDPVGNPVPLPRGTDCRTAQTRTLTSTTVTTYTYERAALLKRSGRECAASLKRGGKECVASLKRSGKDAANRLTSVNGVAYTWYDDSLRLGYSVPLHLTEMVLAYNS
jgi:hypothetical protein